MESTEKQNHSTNPGEQPTESTFSESLTQKEPENSDPDPLEAFFAILEEDDLKTAEMKDDARLMHLLRER